MCVPRNLEPLVARGSRLFTLGSDHDPSNPVHRRARPPYRLQGADDPLVRGGGNPSRSFTDVRRAPRVYARPFGTTGFHSARARIRFSTRRDPRVARSGIAAQSAILRSGARNSLRAVGERREQTEASGCPARRVGAHGRDRVPRRAGGLSHPRHARRSRPWPLPDGDARGRGCLHLTMRPAPSVRWSGFPWSGFPWSGDPPKTALSGRLANDKGGEMPYTRVSMKTWASRSWTAACRRHIATALCALVFVASLHLAHANAFAPPASIDQAVAALTQSEGEQPPVDPVGVACHACEPCAFKNAPSPVATVSLARFAALADYSAHPPPALCPAALPSPFKPPRI